MTLVDAVALMTETSCGVDPERARGQCFNESYRFVKILECYGIEAEVVSGIHVTKDKDRTSFLVNHGHAAALVGDTVYDFTARQFYPHDQPFPLVQTLEEFREAWPEVSVATRG